MDTVNGNRIIKFRAWDKEELKMNHSGIIGSGSSSEVINIGFDGLVSLQNAFGLDYGSRNPVFDKPETRFTLMQYTGLKDKNGNEIYEGDIVLANGSESVLIYDYSEARKFVSPTIQDERRFEPRRSAYKVYWQDNFSQFSFMSLSEPRHSINTDINSRDYEIIGNIYENPEFNKITNG